MKFAGWLLRQLITVIGYTLRWRVDDPSNWLKNGPLPVIFVFWHNRVFLMPHLFRTRWPDQDHPRVAVLVSASQDGEKLVQVLQRFNLICVRGSTSRRGRQALVELTRLARNGYSIGITPDGPRGPRYKVQDGVVQLAQVTQLPMVPVSWDADWKLVVHKAWDKFQVPLPFSRVTLRIAPPLTIPRQAEAADREHKKLELENILKSLSAS